jgi:hypothetical protein
LIEPVYALIFLLRLIFMSAPLRSELFSLNE